MNDSMCTDIQKWSFSARQPRTKIECTCKTEEPVSESVLDRAAKRLVTVVGVLGEHVCCITRLPDPQQNFVVQHRLLLLLSVRHQRNNSATTWTKIVGFSTETGKMADTLAINDNI